MLRVGSDEGLTPVSTCALSPTHVRCVPKVRSSHVDIAARLSFPNRQGLPELCNENGAPCPDSCPTQVRACVRHGNVLNVPSKGSLFLSPIIQAWSMSCVLDYLYDTRDVRRSSTGSKVSRRSDGVAASSVLCRGSVLMSTSFRFSPCAPLPQGLDATLIHAP